LDKEREIDLAFWKESGRQSIETEKNAGYHKLIALHKGEWGERKSGIRKAGFVCHGVCVIKIYVL
jgi:hypothetical protein